MTKVLVLYYSMYGHIEKMAYAVADGAREVDGVDVVVKRVPELVPEEIAKQNHFKLDQPAPVATPAELAEYGRFHGGRRHAFRGQALEVAQLLRPAGGL